MAIADILGDRVFCGPLYAFAGKATQLPMEKKCKEWALAVDGLLSLGQYALDHGVSMGIEPINGFRISVVNTVDQAMRLCRDICLGRRSSPCSKNTASPGISQWKPFCPVELDGFGAQCILPKMTWLGRG